PRGAVDVSGASEGRCRQRPARPCSVRARLPQARMRSPRLLTAAGTCCSTQIRRKYSARTCGKCPIYAANGSRLVRRKLEGWTMLAGRRLLTAPGWLVLGLALAANAQTLATSGRVSTTAESVCVLRAIAAKHLDP